MIMRLESGGKKMGQKGLEILGLDSKALVKMLNEALAEEWYAFYQYWVGARVMEGPMRSNIETELLNHAQQEFNHANLLIERITQLDGTPILTPAEWSDYAECPYEKPDDPYIEVVLQQNLRGERCAINRYKKIADYTQGKDHSTYMLATTILNEELEHEQDIEDWIRDIERIKEDIRKIKF